MELNPFSYEFHADPYPTYRWLRDNAPCYRNEELGFWALTRYADVLEASRDWETFSSADGPMIEKMADDHRFLPMLINLDPPRHDELRSLVSRVFTPRRVAALEADARAIAGRYLDALLDAGGGDFVQQFSALLPMDIIFTLLGAPEADREALRHDADVMLERDPDDNGLPPRAIEAGARLTFYWMEYAAAKRKQPGDDFVSGLVQADLTDAEVAGFCGLIGAAGTETVTKLLGNLAVLLARHPDQRAALVTDSAAIPGAVEEALRYWPPSQYQGRSATRDVTMHGRTIPAGDRVILVTGSASRDDRVYDDPDRFDVFRRTTVLPLGFGHGAHFCLGAALARLEGRVGLEEFLARFPTYSIDESNVRRVHMSNVHGFSSVPFAA